MIGVGVLNPVLDRELRQRSRSRRTVVMISLFLLMLVGVMFVVYEATTNNSQFNFDPFAALTVRVGRNMFEWVLAAELIFLLFIVPGVSANAISGERDRQTLAPLQVTLVGPIGLFMGKVLASTAFIFMLLMASLPILAVPFLVGGIALSSVLLSMFTLMSIGFLIAVIGVSCSAIFKRTQTATLAAYGCVLALVIGTLAGMAVLSVIDGSRGTDRVEARFEALYPNPFVAVADAAGDLTSQGQGPFTPIKRAFLESQVGDQVFFQGNIAFDGRTGQPIQLDSEVGRIPLWARSLLSQALIALAFAIVAIRRLRAPRKVLT